MLTELRRVLEHVVLGAALSHLFLALSPSWGGL